MTESGDGMTIRPPTDRLTDWGTRALAQEDKVHHVLMYACRNCPYEEETHNPCVYKHDLIVAAK